MRKLISLLLALVMILSCTGFAFADEENTELKPAAMLSGMYYDAETGSIFFTDTNAKLIRVLDETGGLSIYCGKSSVTGLDGIPLPAYNDGTFEEASFAEPWAITPFLDGYAVSDAGNGKLRYVADGKVQTINISSSLVYPTGLAADEKGNLYVADTGADKILVINTKGRVIKTITGLYEPTGLFYKDGTLYIAETGKNRIMIYKDGALSLLTGKAIEDGDEYLGGFTNGKLADAQFSHPEGICAAEDGIIYVADTGNSAIRVIEEGRVTTFMQGSGSSTQLVAPRSIITLDEFLYVTDNFTGACTVTSRAINAFTDVEDSQWYAAAVGKAKAYNLISGNPDGTFAPDKNVTRAQFATMLANTMLQLDGQMVIGGEKDFADVKDSDWFASFVRWAGDKGFMAGSVNGDKTYAMPNGNLTREQLVTMLYNVAEGQKLTVSATKEAAMDNYPDAGTISAYALIPMEWALNAGLLSGYSDGTLQPGTTVTRAQAASILTNFLEAVGF